MKLFALFLILSFTTSVVFADRVLLTNGLEVEAEFLTDLICLDNENVERFIEPHRLTPSRAENFLQLRYIIRTNLQDTSWYPPPYQEKADYCTLVEVILSSIQECSEISQERLVDLKADCEYQGFNF